MTCVILLFLFVSTWKCSAWVISDSVLPTLRTSGLIKAKSSLSLASEDASSLDKGNEEEFKQRMALVRSIQKSFYKSTSNSTSCLFDQSAGMLFNLPLWRVDWTELPGRSNVLNVHNAIYTNMFETILYGPKPWYLGHLYQAKSEKSNNTDLKSWEKQVEVDGESRGQHESSAVVGTLLRISDYRRMADGRLLILVQALERFVVVNVQQHLPYIIADIQIMPDEEEVDPDLSWVEKRTEGEVHDARALAIAESFQRYHRYEYDQDFELPVPDKADLEVAEVFGSSIAKVLPYVPFSKTTDLATLQQETVVVEKTSHHTLSTVDRDIPLSSEKEGAIYDQPCLECRLIAGDVLKEPELANKNNEKFSVEELEYKLWVALNDFLTTTRIPVAPPLLGLLPPQTTSWPETFVLKKAADDLTKQTKMQHNCVRISPLYPSYRRQRLISYSVAKVVEQRETNEDLRQDIRQKLLEIPSTKGRLRMLLEMFETINSEIWGEFQ